jgi:hypothetical protein
VIEAGGRGELWHGETYPMLVASFQLALEGYDTFGPSPVRLTDPIEASNWNNERTVRHQAGSAVTGCFLRELHAGGESEFGVDVGEVGLHGAR